jgi:hypothetical protein
MMMSFEKKIAFPRPVPVCLIQPAFASLLNFHHRIWALWSSITKSPSTMTTAPSMIIPKSTAPSESKLALIPASFKHKNANNKDKGMMMETISVVLQSAMKIKTITVTNNSFNKVVHYGVCGEIHQVITVIKSDHFYIFRKHFFIEFFNFALLRPKLHADFLLSASRQFLQRYLPDD